LKTVSNPTETALAERQVDQKQLIKRIIELTPRYIVTDYTRFKYLLAHANPNAKLITRLWKILENHPELYKSVCKYIRRYEQLPRVPAAKVVAILQQNPLYHSIRSEFISAVDGRLPPAEDKALAKLLRKMWSPRSDHPDLGFVSAFGCISHTHRQVNSWPKSYTLVHVRDIGGHAQR